MRLRHWARIRLGGLSAKSYAWPTENWADGAGNKPDVCATRCHEVGLHSEEPQTAEAAEAAHRVLGARREAM